VASILKQHFPSHFIAVWYFYMFWDTMMVAHYICNILYLAYRHHSTEDVPLTSGVPRRGVWGVNPPPPPEIPKLSQIPRSVENKSVTT
jgi:hypothetical protein